MENDNVKKVGHFLNKLAYMWGIYPDLTFESLVRVFELGKKNMHDLVNSIDEVRANMKTDDKDT